VFGLLSARDRPCDAGEHVIDIAFARLQVFACQHSLRDSLRGQVHMRQPEQYAAKQMHSERGTFALLFGLPILRLRVVRVWLPGPMGKAVPSPARGQGHGDVSRLELADP
jgi:hypothetical protein